MSRLPLDLHSRWEPLLSEQEIAEALRELEACDKGIEIPEVAFQQFLDDDPYSRLVDFLYTLGRDYMSLGEIEDIMFNQIAGKEGSSYCNTFLEEYARDLARRLMDLDAPLTNWKHMYLSADRSERITGGDNPHYGS